MKYLRKYVCKRNTIYILFHYSSSIGFFVANIHVAGKTEGKELYMLKLTLKPGEYIDIGEEIRVVFSGGSSNNVHLLVDAPRSFSIVRSSVNREKATPYYKEQGISEQAKKEIAEILKKERAEKRR